MISHGQMERAEQERYYASEQPVDDLIPGISGVFSTNGFLGRNELLDASVFAAHPAQIARAMTANTVYEVVRDPQVPGSPVPRTDSFDHSPNSLEMAGLVGGAQHVVADFVDGQSKAFGDVKARAAYTANAALVEALVLDTLLAERDDTVHMTPGSLDPDAFGVERVASSEHKDRFGKKALVAQVEALVATHPDAASGVDLREYLTAMVVFMRTKDMPRPERGKDNFYADRLLDSTWHVGTVILDRTVSVAAIGLATTDEPAEQFRISAQHNRTAEYAPDSPRVLVAQKAPDAGGYDYHYARKKGTHKDVDGSRIKIHREELRRNRRVLQHLDQYVARGPVTAAILNLANEDFISNFENGR